jgi:hypothetical protein
MHLSYPCRTNDASSPSGDLFVLAVPRGRPRYHSRPHIHFNALHARYTSIIRGSARWSTMAIVECARSHVCGFIANSCLGLCMAAPSRDVLSAPSRTLSSDARANEGAAHTKCGGDGRSRRTSAKSIAPATRPTIRITRDAKSGQRYQYRYGALD